MRKFTLFSQAVILCAAPAFAVSTPAAEDLTQATKTVKKVFKLLSPSVSPQHPKALRLAATRSDEGVWLAQNESMSMWEDEWIHAEDNNLTYNEEGRVLVQLSTEYEGEYIMGYTRTTNTYDANGMVTSRFIEASTDGIEFRPSDKRTVAYDPIMTNVIISNEQTLWYEDEEYPGNCYHFDITRDEKGNVTNVERAVLFDGYYDPTERFTVEYGEDGKAVSAEERMLFYDRDTQEYFWEDGERIYNIVWEETDGQFYSIDSMMDGNNKPKSATLYDDEMGIEMALEMSYSEGGVATATMTLPEMPGMVWEIVTTPLPYGGSTYTMTAKYGGTVFMSMEETIEYAPNGLILREYISVEGGDEESMHEESRGVFFGDEEQPEAYEYSIYDVVEDEWIPSMRIEFSDYKYFSTNPLGIEDVDYSSEAPAEYFNLQGIKIAKPEKGTFCIERKGGKARIIK